MSDATKVSLGSLALSADRTFNIGDVCQMRSGGPLMTMVKAVAGDIGCAWFLPNGAIGEAKFDPRCLRKVDVEKMLDAAKDKGKEEGKQC